MEKAHLTLYTVIGSPQHILTGIQSLFAPVIQSVDTEADQIRVTLQDDSLLVFHLSHVREKAGFIEMHIEGMANYFAQAATSNPALKENVLRQIRCFNCVVGIVFETDDNNDRTRYLINPFRPGPSGEGISALSQYALVRWRRQAGIFTGRGK